MNPHPRRRSLTGRTSSERRVTPAITPPQAHQPVAPSPRNTPAIAPDPEPVLYTAEQAAEMLQVRPSWLRRKATARAVPCRFLGKHLRFARADIDAIADASLQPVPQGGNNLRTNRR